VKRPEVLHHLLLINAAILQSGDTSEELFRAWKRDAQQLPLLFANAGEGVGSPTGDIGKGAGTTFVVPFENSEAVSPLSTK